MIDLNILNEGSSTKQRAAVKVQTLAAVASGAFTYTEVMSLPEPLKSHALEVIDGTHVENNQAKSGQWDTLDNEPKKLVHIDPKGDIKGYVRVARTVPGTTTVRYEEIFKSFGNVADVPDLFPTRLARQILHREGWPIRQNLTEGSREGTIVEWRWLEREAKKDNPGEGIKELYEEILTRPGFSGQAPEPTIKKSRAPGESRAGV